MKQRLKSRQKLKNLDIENIISSFTKQQTSDIYLRSLELWESYVKWVTTQFQSDRYVAFGKIGVYAFKTDSITNDKVPFLFLNEAFIKQNKLIYRAQQYTMKPIVKVNCQGLAKNVNMSKEEARDVMQKITEKISKELINNENKEINLKMLGTLVKYNGEIIFEFFRKIRQKDNFKATFNSTQKTFIRQIVDKQQKKFNILQSDKKLIVNSKINLPQIQEKFRKTQIRPRPINTSIKKERQSSSGLRQKSSSVTHFQKDLSPTRRFKRTQSNILSQLLGAGTDPLKRNQDFAKLAKDPKDLINTKFILPNTFQKRYPPLIDKFARTLACPISGQRQNPLVCARIGSNFTPDTKTFQIFSNGISSIKLPSSNFEPQISTSVIISDEQQYKIIIEQNNDSSERQKLQIKNKCYQRYNKLMQIIEDQHIAKYKQIWLDHIFMCLPKKYQNKQIINRMIIQVYQNYKYSVRKAILDYILMEKIQMNRLGVHKIFKSIRYYGQDQYRGIIATKQIQQNNKIASEILLQLLSINSIYILKIKQIWSERENKLLIQLPKQGQQYITIQSFEENQKLLLKKRKEDILGNWINLLSQVYRHQISELNRDQQKSQRFFESTSILLYNQLRGLIQQSLLKYKNFLEKYWDASPNPPQTILLLQEKGKYQNCFLLIKLIANKGQILFANDLGEVQNKLLNIVDEIIKFLDKIPRPQNIISKTENLYLREINMDSDEFYKKIYHRIRNIIQINLKNTKEVLKIYNSYQYILNQFQVIQKWIMSGNYDRREYSMKIQKYKKLYDQVLEKMPYFVRINMVYVDSTQFKKKILKIIQSIIQRLERAIYQIIMSRNNHIFKQLTRMIQFASEKAFTSQKIVELQTFIEKCQRNDFRQINELHRDMIKWISNTLYATNYKITDEDLRQIYITSDYLHKFNDRLEVQQKRIFSERILVQKRIQEKSKQFAQKVQQLIKQVQKLKQFGSRMLKDSALQLTQFCRTKINEYKNQLKNQINGKQQLLGMNISEFPKFVEADYHLKPYQQLWKLVRQYTINYTVWTKQTVFKQDVQNIQLQTKQMCKTAINLSQSFPKVPNATKVATQLLTQITEFQKNIPIIAVFANPGLKQRHLNQISTIIGLQQPIKHDQNISLNRLLNLSVMEHIQHLQVLSQTASKQFTIQQSLLKMNQEWIPVQLQTKAFKQTGTYIMLGNSIQQIITILDDQNLKVITMKGSIYSKIFINQLDALEDWLTYTYQFLDYAVKVQGIWMYLEPVMTSPDILKHLAVQGTKFKKVDQIWRQTMKYCNLKKKVKSITENRIYLNRLKQALADLDIVQKGLNAYLESKRLNFPRFFFLSNEELLEILSETKDPTKVQPHLKKCFEGIQKLYFEDSKNILGMYSSQNQYVKFTTQINTTLARGNVDQWLIQVQAAMIENVKREIQQAYDYFKVMKRQNWVLNRCGMAVLNIDMVFWTFQVQSSIKKGKGLSGLLTKMNNQLSKIISLIRSPDLSMLNRLTLQSLIVLSVHNLDITNNLQKAGNLSINNFNWQSQLRYYFVNEQTQVRILNAICQYNNQYLGNSSRLVITPLTDRCYRTLCSAVYLNYGGAPEGPAGTGKTETVKDLAKALARQCVVFNCSDGLDYKAMGKFFKGLASSGAWSCFDQFNRIDLQVLSVVAQQILTIQIARAKKLQTFLFEDTQITMKKTANCFITMNPGYAGRSQLPDNLKALFRTVAMMVPDYAMIAEISLYSYGFTDARNLARKIVTTYKLCSQQLSSQQHYDYGMRAVKSVLIAAGNLKRRYINENQSILMLKAINDVNLAKFLAFDIPLFKGITSDLFPGIKQPQVDYAALLKSLQIVLSENNLQPHHYILEKIIQIYDMILVRHGLMVVGLPFSGKSTALKMLANAISLCAKQTTMNQLPVQFCIINPKSISLKQLYGCFDQVSHEWSDGVLAVKFRNYAKSQQPTRKWLILDGPVDAVWIQNMNTVLDDNKKMCLTSGQIIAMNKQMNLIFEPMDLLVASPATVSRCGMIYMEPQSLGWQVLHRSWINTLSNLNSEILTDLSKLFQISIHDSYKQISNLKIISNVSISSLIATLQKLINIAFKPFLDNPTLYEKIDIKHKFNIIGSLYIFCLVWSFGACLDSKSRKPFDIFLKKMFSGDLSSDKTKKKKIILPQKGSLFDYLYKLNQEKFVGQWIRWVDTLQQQPINLKKIPIYNVIVKTADTVRYQHFVELSIMNELPILLCGPTGTGKTTYIKNLLLNKLSKQIYSYIEMIFSAQTSSNQTQQQLESKLQRRGKGLVGPKTGKLILFVDDLNMPVKQKFGSQPPIQFLRQCIDQKGFYDHKQKQRNFKKLIDFVFVFSMGEPGGGRTYLSPRFLRHSNLISVTNFDQQTLNRIFLALFNASFKGHSQERHLQSLLNHCISLYNQCVNKLLPTPTKSHYLFNLRDLSKLVIGICKADKQKVHGQNIGRLFAHEAKRVFMDRLLQSDRQTVDKWIKQIGRKWGKNTTDVYWTDIISNSIQKSYQEVMDIEKIIIAATSSLNNYNIVSDKPMDLVLFNFAIEHLLIILRIIKQPKGNALLVGVGGSGRQSLARLACFICDYDSFEIEITKNYNLNQFHEDMRKLLKNSGVKNKQTVFIFNDGQIKSESFAEDLNNLLNTGQIPNLFTSQQKAELVQLLRKDAVQSDPNKSTPQHIYSFFINRVRKNLRICLCFSPIGEMFRTRVRMFPSLINCTTIDWYQQWPKDALISVAKKFLSTIQLDHKETFNNLCEYLHGSTKKWSENYKKTLKRHYYVTPTSYIQLISIFKVLLAQKRKQNKQLIYKYENGYEKIIQTEKSVEQMKINLQNMKPILKKAAQDTLLKMDQVAEQKKQADFIMQQISHQQIVVVQAVNEANEIKKQCEKDLAVALPALRAAQNALLVLDKNKLTQLKTMMNPPQAVKLVMQGVCLLIDPTPKQRIKNQKTLKMEIDWWGASVRLLGNPKLLNVLVDLDKQNILQSIVINLGKFLNDPNNKQILTQQNVANSSLACQCLIKWINGIYNFYWVNKKVRPKKQSLKEAEAKVAVLNKKLQIKQQELASANKKVEDLNFELKKAERNKERLQKQYKICEISLERASTIIENLGGQKMRWLELSNINKQYSKQLESQVLLASSIIAYLGAFTQYFRNSIVAQWYKEIKKYLNISNDVSLRRVLGDPIKIRNWNLNGLPLDEFSIQNALILFNSRRWPLMIDPQSQANKWLKKLQAERKLKIIKLSQDNYLRILQNCIQFGTPVLLQNINQQIDAAVTPVLLKQTYKKGATTYLKLGQQVLVYSNDFYLYITTKLRNPHYLPEISTKVTLINFMITQQGLSDQLLAIVVSKQRPELQVQKQKLLIQSTQNKKTLRSIEDKILDVLSNSQNILADETAIKVLSASKAKANEINQKQIQSQKTQQQIDKTRKLYAPIAQEGSLLFFVVSDLGNIDPMYQYSLAYFIQLFVQAIKNSEKSFDLNKRLDNLKLYFRKMLYNNISRSLFQKDRLLLSVLITLRLLKVDSEQLRFILTGGTDVGNKIPQKPRDKWITQKMWSEIYRLSSIEKFQNILFLFNDNNSLALMQKIVSSSNPLEQKLPAYFQNFSTLQKLLLYRCLRPDKMIPSFRKLVQQNIGDEFTKSLPYDLAKIYPDSNCQSPLIFLLSPGSDPFISLTTFAQSRKIQMSSISLGQGQGPIAQKMISDNCVKGGWVVLQNCHLAVTWMKTLEKIVQQISTSENINKNFRLWLTSYPTQIFPQSVLQQGLKITNEPPQGLKNNLMLAFLTDPVSDPDFFNSSLYEKPFKKLLFSLCFFHSVIQQRRKYGPLGWNISYEFTQSDLRISCRQLKIYLDGMVKNQIPFQALIYLTAQCNYGGRVTDDKDRRLIITLLHDYYNKQLLLDPSHNYGQSEQYILKQGMRDYDDFIKYIEGLPLIGSPELVGLHPNADITRDMNESSNLLETLLLCNSNKSSGQGVSFEDTLNNVVQIILNNFPKEFNLAEGIQKYPVIYEQSMNTVLNQQLERFNKLLNTIQSSLIQLKKALKGLATMSLSLQKASKSLFDGKVPDIWMEKSYPSLKPLASYIKDLKQRTTFFANWIQKGIPKLIWISGFFFTQSFLTGILQNYSRKVKIPVDQIVFQFDIIQNPVDQIHGANIYGLFIQGARWDEQKNILNQSKPKQIYCKCPYIYLKPVRLNEVKDYKFYQTPTYKTSTRRGVLSTTGHSTNFVMYIKMPTEKDSNHWIKRGVALLTQLND